MTSSPRWTRENLQRGGVGTLPFDTLLEAVLWHWERPPVPWPVNEREIREWRREYRGPIREGPVTYYPSSERGENASTRRAKEAAALIEWLDRMGVLPKWPRAEDPQCDDLAIILAKIKEIDTLKRLRRFLRRMSKRCPWLKQEWPGATISASESEWKPTDLQQHVWDKIAGRYVNATTLASPEELDIEPEGVRQIVRALRAAGRVIKTRKGNRGGYWRPDAPPPE